MNNDNNEIKEIFEDNERLAYSDYENNINKSYLPTKTINSKISSLSEIFVEWYLFDSSELKSVSEFLKSENVDDVFSEQDFLNVISGDYNLNEQTLNLVMYKIPFKVSHKKLFILNYKVEKSKSFKRTIEPNPDVLLEKILLHNKVKRKGRAQYYQRNKEYIIQKSKEYYQKNKDKLREKNLQNVKEWVKKNRERRKQYKKEYDQRIKTHRLKYQAEYRARKKEELLSLPPEEAAAKIQKIKDGQAIYRERKRQERKKEKLASIIAALVAKKNFSKSD